MPIPKQLEMKNVLLLAAAVVVGLFTNRLVQPTTYSTTSAQVLSIQKVRNVKKGDKPFVYRVDLLYETTSGRQQRSRMTARQLPTYKIGDAIMVQYQTNRPNRVQAVKRKKKRTRIHKKPYL
jgi:hypothetical protein